MGDLVDLDAYRIKKQKELEEKQKAEQEEKDLEEIQHMRYLLNTIIENLGNPHQTGSLFYVPMSDDEYFNHYQSESGYNKDGYYETTWEWDGPLADEEYYTFGKDDEEDY